MYLLRLRMLKKHWEDEPILSSLLLLEYGFLEHDTDEWLITTLQRCSRWGQSALTLFKGQIPI